MITNVNDDNIKTSIARIFWNAMNMKLHMAKKNVSRGRLKTRTFKAGEKITIIIFCFFFV